MAAAMSIVSKHKRSRLDDSMEDSYMENAHFDEEYTLETPDVKRRLGEDDLSSIKLSPRIDLAQRRLQNAGVQHDIMITVNRFEFVQRQRGSRSMLASGLLCANHFEIRPRSE
jgi:hypothetical protein